VALILFHEIHAIFAGHVYGTYDKNRHYEEIGVLTGGGQGHSIHYIGFFMLLVDFCVSGIPVRLLHIVQPLGFSLLYNLALFAYTWATYRKGPFYRVADYFSLDTEVR